MKKTVSLSILFLLACSLVSLPAQATTTTTSTADPNAEIRRITQKGQDSALADLEKIRKINNDAAIRHFGDILKKDPKSADAYAKRGKAYSGNRDYVAALADYEKAIELNPKLPDAYIGRAVISLTKKDYDKCWKDVHQAESLGGQFWPSFMDALKTSSGRDK